MNQKYTSASALTIKRDVQRSQVMLGNLNREIEEKRVEKQQLDTILDEKRSLVRRFEDMMLAVFSRRETEHDGQKKKMAQLEVTISKMETARDLLQTEINLKKQEVKEPAGAKLMSSVIKELEQTLDALLNQIDVSEKELDAIESKKAEFAEANKQLEKEAEAQYKVVKTKRVELEAVDRKRQQILKEMAEEKQKLNLIRQRERDSEALNRRLTTEYQEVYQSLPRRKSK